MSFDPNLRLNLWPDRDEMRAVVNTVAARATVVMPGLAEGRLLTGHDDPEAIAKFYLRRRRAGSSDQAGRRGRPSLDRRRTRRLSPARSPSPRSTPSAPATALPPATSRLFSPAAACKNELIKAPPSAPWPPPGAATWPPCRSEKKSMP